MTPQNEIDDKSNVWANAVETTQSQSENRRCFGWDLAAYGKRSDSALCFVEWSLPILQATIIQYGKVCKPKLEMTDSIEEVVKAEAELLEYCCSRCSLYVDIPIDLQSLGKGLLQRRNELRVRPKYAWQLYRRPIDQMLKAIPPLAAELGYPVARLVNILQSLEKRPDTLCETYPAASLRFVERNSGIDPVTDKYRWIMHLRNSHVKNWDDALAAFFGTTDEIAVMKKAREADLDRVRAYFLHAEKESADFAEAVDAAFEAKRSSLQDGSQKPPYKGGVVFWSDEDGKWLAKPSVDLAQKLRNQCLADLANALGFMAADSLDQFTADEFDAVLCAAVGGFPDEYRVPKEELDGMVRRHLSAHDAFDGVNDPLVPEGYELLKTWPKVPLVQVRKSPLLETLSDVKSYLGTERFKVK